MFTVSILVNNKPIYTRTAVKQYEVEYHPEGEGEKGVGVFQYKLDDGSTIYHNPKNGAIDLAKKMLDTIKEVQ